MAENAAMSSRTCFPKLLSIRQPRLTRMPGIASLLALSIAVAAGCGEKPRRQVSSQVLPAATSETTSAAGVEPPPPPAEVIEEVGADDAVRGRTLQGGYLQEVLGQRFHIEHRLIFMNVKKAIDLYQATNGFKPKSHEVFWSEIIEANSIQLPELYDDWEYYYDADSGELMKRKLQ